MRHPELIHTEWGKEGVQRMQGPMQRAIPEQPNPTGVPVEICGESRDFILGAMHDSSAVIRGIQTAEILTMAIGTAYFVHPVISIDAGNGLTGVTKTFEDLQHRGVGFEKGQCYGRAVSSHHMRGNHLDRCPGWEICGKVIPIASFDETFGNSPFSVGKLRKESFMW